MAVDVSPQASSYTLAGELRRFRKLRLAGRIGEILKYFLIIALSLSYLLPFYWMVSSSLKDDTQIFVIPPKWVPVPAHPENFWNAWFNHPFYEFNAYLFNTVFRYAIPVTIGTVLSSMLCAYGFARLRWPGRDSLFSFLMATMMIPWAVRMVPLFITFSKLRWVNTFLPLVVPAFLGGGAWNIFMLRQFFLTIPEELSDSARIDGCSEFGIMWRIIVPLAKPALAVVALFSFTGAWNDFMGPLIYNNRQENYVIALAIRHLQQSMVHVGTGYTLQYPYLMAVSTVTTLPILILFFMAQRTFIEGISLTGLKG